MKPEQAVVVAMRYYDSIHILPGRSVLFVYLSSVMRIISDFIIFRLLQCIEYTHNAAD